MMRTRRALVIVVLLLLASAATAHAECAWVLWREEVTRECDRQGKNCREVSRTSGPLDGYTNKDVCNKELVAYSSGLTQSPGPKLSLRYLPDTLDPRGPKGK